MQAFAVSSLLLLLLVGAGILAITVVRSRMLDGTPASGTGSGHGDWESALAKYKNLRDKGVLSDEEYRKITALVEPHVPTDPTTTAGRPFRGPPRPAPGSETPDHPRPPSSTNPTRT